MGSEKTAMVSHFSQYSSSGRIVLDENEELIMGYVDKMLQFRKKEDIITLADFGTADGGNVIPCMNKIIDYVQEKLSADQHIKAVFEDQSSNDFNALVQNITGTHDREGLRRNGNVNALVSPSSMYGKCLPDGSLDVGLSIYTVHWLSYWPVKLRDSIFATDADPSELSLIRDQAAQDWRAFVTSRGRELKSGGFMFVSALMTGEDRMLKLITSIYKGMVTEDIITEREFKNTNMEAFNDRTEDDFKLPFNDSIEDSEMSRLELELVYFKLHTRENFPHDQSCSDNEEFETRRAERISNLVKGSLYNSLYHGLSQDRNKGERTHILDVFFERLRKTVLSEGRRFRCINHMADLIFTKRFHQ